MKKSPWSNMWSFSLAVVFAFGIISCSTEGNAGEVEAATKSEPKVFELSSVESSTDKAYMSNFSWKDASGKEISLSEVADGKVVFLNFWATWCPPCRKEIPDIVELSKEMGKDVYFIGISFDRGNAAEVVTKYADKNGIEYTNVIGNSEISNAYGSVSAIPTTFIIDRKGVIAYKLQGAFSKEAFKEKLDEVVAQK